MADRFTPETTGRHDLYARYVDSGDGSFKVIIASHGYVWNPATSTWDKATQATGGGGGVDPVGLKNTSAVAINPATEDTLATRLAESVFTGRVGEVQASPTANTVLGRLKALETALALLLAEATFTGRLGEVQASPTANTLLGRLKDITDQVTPLLEEVTFTGRLGEVQASPTQYTVLERLKVLGTLLNGGLPAALTAGAGLKVGLVDALPAGTNNIGDVDVLSTVQPAAPTTPTSGVKTVTTAATRVQLDTVTCKSVSIKAHSANTGLIYVGGSGVAAANGYRLSAGDTVDIAIDNVNRLWIDSAVNGEGVSYLAVN